MAKQGKTVKTPKIALKPGATAKRGLMLKMVQAVTKAPLTREELAERFRKEPRSKVLMNVAWGLRHGVFIEKRA